MIRALISLVVAAALAIMVLPWSWRVLDGQFVQRILHAPGPWPEDGWSVIAGGVAGMALMLWRRPNWLIHTTIHELAHLIACLLLMVPVHSFRATGGHGGDVMHARSDPLRETVISIAPYTVPLVLIPCLLAVRLTPPGHWHSFSSGLSACAYVQHIQGLYHNVRLNFLGPESDLAKVGRPLSVVLIVIAFLLVTSWVIAMLWI